MRVLISGASISGPVLAYWLTKYGFDVTVVERAPVLRKTGGHAVDLFRPAVDISERMGVLPRIERKATGTDRLTLLREGAANAVRVDLARIYQATSDRHVEIMRDDLSEIYYEATRDTVEYIFGDSVTELADRSVTFENGPARDFDLVIGADGLHSNVRRLVFGQVGQAFIGAYLAVQTVPNHLNLDGEFITHLGPGRLAGFYGARHLSDGRVLFMFRSAEELDYHYRDVGRQKEILRRTFAGMHGDVDRWLSELDTTPAFYFDSVTQLRTTTWSRGRVTLVGDAGYCPGPAVGGSTSLAVVGAYTLAGELAAAGGDYERAYAAYETEMAPLVRGARAFALGAAKTLIPDSKFGVWALAYGLRLFTALPPRVGKVLAKLNTKGVRLYDRMPVKNYPAHPHT